LSNPRSKLYETSASEISARPPRPRVPNADCRRVSSGCLGGPTLRVIADLAHVPTSEALRPRASAPKRASDARDLPLWQRKQRLRKLVLIDFQAKLFRRQVRGRPITVKTVRNLIDWHFRALYRDARDIDHLVEGDPFARIPWPRVPRKKNQIPS
jgi:hypothetical protein